MAILPGNLEQILLDFDQNWNSDRLAALVKQLPTDDSVRGTFLIELIKIDLERHWQQGQHPIIESYLQQFPELGTTETVSTELLFAEYQVRRQFGEKAPMKAMIQRFPSQEKQLRQLASKNRSSRSVSRQALRPTPNSEQATTEDSSNENDFSPPEQFGRYRILRQLGQGGMANVYLAHDGQLDREIALKIPQFKGSNKSKAQARFEREARAAASLEHPNICPVYDVGSIDGIPYLAMAYVQGRSLADYLSQTKSISTRQSVALIRKIALILQEAHDRGVIHRDLKPSNIMINQRKEPVVMDFGLARQINHSGPRLTQMGSIMGTPSYMPPEQVNGDIDAMGATCDIYSLGVMLYELLAGRVPFEGPTAAVLGQVIMKEPEPPSVHNSELDKALEQICLKAISKQPEQRFTSMAQFASALSDWLKATSTKKTDGIQTPKSSPTLNPFSSLDSSDDSAPIIQSAARRRVLSPWIWLSLAVIGLAIVLGIVFLIQTEYGTVKIELSDPNANVHVKIDEDIISIEGLKVPYKLKVGAHRLEITGPNFETHSESFTIKEGQDKILQVTLIRKESVISPKNPVPPPTTPQPQVPQKEMLASLVYVKVDGDRRMPLGIVTKSGVCTVMPGGFRNVKLTTLDGKKTFDGKVVSRKPFPFCWIESEELNLQPVTQAKSGAFRKPHDAFIVLANKGTPEIQSGKIVAGGAFAGEKEIRPGQRGIIAPGPIFAKDGTCLGYSLRSNFDKPIVVHRLRKE